MYLFAFFSTYNYYGADMISDFSQVNAFVLNKTESGWTMYNPIYEVYITDNSYNGSYFYDLPSSPNTESYWIIDDEGSDAGHYIMRSEMSKFYSETDKYWGTKFDGTNIYTNHQISNASKYVFIDAEVREHYLASKKLYNAILVAQGKNLYVPNYESFYNDRDNHTAAEIYAQANELIAATNLTSLSGVVSSNNEVPLVVCPTMGDWNTTNDYRFKGAYTYSDASLSVKFNVDKSASLFYQVDRYYYRSDSYMDKTGLEVFVDGNKVEYYEISDENIKKVIHNTDNSILYRRFFIDVEPGEHIVELKKEGGQLGFYNIGIMQCPLITVSLAEPGSLGTEVLYNVDGVKDVKSLKVIGKINGDDWAKIAMMDNLMNLDLSEAIFTEVPEKALSRTADASFGFLHNVVLPEGLIKIGNYAFDGTYLKTVNIPSTVTTIGAYAFQYNNFKIINMPNSVTSIGNYCFSGCCALREVTLSNNLSSIPDYAFYYCENLKRCDLPEGITSVGKCAFYCNYSLSQTLPSTLQSIGNSAYYICRSLCSDSNGELIIPENVSTIGFSAFSYCTDIVTIDLPTKFYAINGDNSHLLQNCSNVTKIILRCPTLITHTYKSGSSTYEAVLGCDLSKVDLFVPDYLVPNYKLDEYWYNYKTITGFETSKVQDWTINNPMVMTDRGRFLGTPDITIKGNKDRMPSLKIFGEAPMSINDLHFNGSYSDTYYNYPGQILSNCSNITVTGNVQTNLWSKAKYWYFFSLPFDIKISEITHSADGVQKAVRYYDGANRAANGASGSWKNFAEDAVIPAGTGFIMQTNVDTWNYFHALDNANKQQCVKNAEFVTTLAVNDSENNSNKGWNLVGNPWQCYYNDHALNFTGPITVWDVKNKTYTAYSITDDDYAIAPNEAFFVQCPNEQYNTIGFPTNGRQLTNVIESQNAAKANNAASTRRMIVDVKISNGENEDQTRVVLNEQASLDYDIACDASKMMSMDASVPQIFTMDADGTQYAINERPTDNAVVPLGFFAPADGEYNIQLGRNSAETVVLVDYETGAEQDIVGAEYSFSANAGMNEGRFALKFSAGETTGISNVENAEKPATVVYNLAGQRINRNVKGINIVNGRKIVNK